MVRINRVIDHIEANISEELSLEDLAQVANFSRFHFHRIFKALVGETLNQFIQRLRIEKAAIQLVISKKSITEIALDCGFSSSATFARVFKENYQMSASQWRAGGYLPESKNCKVESKEGKQLRNNRKDFTGAPHYYLGVSSYSINFETKIPQWSIQMKDNQQMQIEVKDMPEFQAAYLRHIGPYQGDSDLFAGLFEKLMKWAGPRDLLRFPETKVLAAYHDDPKITDEEKLRVSACITLPEEAEVDGEIGKMTIPGGKFAVARFEINNDEFEACWDAVMGGWLPESGYQPDDRLCYEMYHNDYKEHPEQKHIFDICVPVKPL